MTARGATTEAWPRTTRRVRRELEVSNVVALDGATVARMADRAVLPLVAKTLMDLALVVGAAARRGTDRHLHGAPSSMGRPGGCGCYPQPGDNRASFRLVMTAVLRLTSAHRKGLHEAPRG
jgi:hypothetical protein